MTNAFDAKPALPDYGPQADLAPSSLLAINHKPSRPERILIVDDDFWVIDVIAKQLSLEGFTIDTTTESDRVMGMLARKNYDLVISDLSMPPPDGLALLKQILEQYPFTAVLMITGVQDVLFYFTGLASVPEITKNTYRPGAVADHLTSFGGQLLGNPHQMSALEWLKAGATASYGTVVEPCNHLSKFPHPGVLMHWYAHGDTLIEAYWKSVASPGEGVFVGEPLARPFGTRIQRDEQGWWVEGHSGKGHQVLIETAPSVVGPYRPVGSVYLPAGYSRQQLPVGKAAAVRVRSSQEPDLLDESQRKMGRTRTVIDAVAGQ